MAVFVDHQIKCECLHSWTTKLQVEFLTSILRR